MQAALRGNRERYCRRHGYRCVLDGAELEEACGGPLSAYAHLLHPPTWGKFAAMLQCAHSQRFERVAWIDSDALLLNLSRPLEDTTAGCDERAPGWTFGVAHSDCDMPYGGRVNAGFIVTRGGAAAAAPAGMLRQALAASVDPAVRTHIWSEQHSLNQIILKPDTSPEWAEAARSVCELESNLHWIILAHPHWGTASAARRTLSSSTGPAATRARRACASASCARRRR